MKRKPAALLSITTRLAGLVALHTATAVAGSKVDDADLWRFDGYCGVGHRAVWVETFDDGQHDGYSYLVCLDNALQETSYWWITPDDRVITDDQLPEFPVAARPIITNRLLNWLHAPDHPINQDPANRAVLSLAFQIDEPVLPELPFSYGLSGSSGVDEHGNAVATVTYWVEGSVVDQASYLAYATLAREAELARWAERDRLVFEQAQLMLYELVSLNDWHSRVDVAAVNAHRGESACWAGVDVLLVGLTRAELDHLIETSESLVTVHAHVVVTTDDVGVNAGIELGESVEAQCASLTSDQAGLDYFSSIGGSTGYQDADAESSDIAILESAQGDSQQLPETSEQPNSSSRTSTGSVGVIGLLSLVVLLTALRLSRSKRLQ